MSQKGNVLFGLFVMLTVDLGGLINSGLLFSPKLFFGGG